MTCYDMQIKQRVHLPMKSCDQEGIWKTQHQELSVVRFPADKFAQAHADY